MMLYQLSFMNSWLQWFRILEKKVCFPDFFDFNLDKGYYYFCLGLKWGLKICISSRSYSFCSLHLIQFWALSWYFPKILILCADCPDFVFCHPGSSHFYFKCTIDFDYRWFKLDINLRGCWNTCTHWKMP